MKKIYFVLALLSLFFLAGCMNPAVTTIDGHAYWIYYDEFNSTADAYTQFNWVNGEILSSLGDEKRNIQINYHKRFSLKEESTLITLALTYNNSSWLFIERGKSLIFLLDGTERIEVASEKGSIGNRTVVSGEEISEGAVYPVKMAFFEKIINAKKVKVRIKGENSYIDTVFTKENFDKTKWFYEDVLKKDLKEKVVSLGLLN
jgi:hypothetical protein